MSSLITISLLLFILSSGLLLYVYIGYPLIIVALARLSRKPVQKNTDYLPTVTLVIPAHNEEIVIEKKLENAFSLDYPRERLQIIVCDDTSSDRTVEIVKQFASRGIELSQGITRSGKVGGLNRALGLATGEIYVITDADITLSPNSLRELAANFADKSVGCVVAQTRMLSSENETGESGGLYWRYEALIRQNESDLHSTVAATGHLQGIRRDIMQPIPENVILDDFYLAMMTSRAGYRVISDPQSIVWERPTSSIGDDVNRRRRLTAGRYQMLLMSGAYFPKLPALLRFQVISHKFLRLGIPHFMILSLLSNILLALLLPGMSSAMMRAAVLGVLAIQVVFYLMALAGKLLSGRAGKKSKLVKLFSLPYFLCATNFASIAGLLWYFSGQHTVLWQQAKRD